MGSIADFKQIAISVIEVHSFLGQSLVDSRSVSEVVVQLRSLFQIRLQCMLSVSEYASEESVCPLRRRFSSKKPTTINTKQKDQTSNNQLNVDSLV